jgi:hypothetical protein
MENSPNLVGVFGWICHGYVEKAENGKYRNKSFTKKENKEDIFGAIFTFYFR